MSVAYDLRAVPAALHGCRLPTCSGVLRLDALELEFGGTLEHVDIAFTIHGEAARPMVVVLGGISAGRHIAGSSDAHGAGWWQEFVGPGRAVDTTKFAVLGIDYIGGAGESTRAGENGFPAVGTGDQATAILAVLDQLGVSRAHAMIGSSYGGMVALAFATRFAHRLRRLAVISAAHESHPMATALRSLQRRVVRLSLESGRGEDGVAIARGIAMTTYRTAEEFACRFEAEANRTPDGFRFPIEPWLEHHGASFARRYPAWSFLCLSESIDLHQVDPRSITTPATLVAVDSDTLVPTWQMQQLAKNLGGPVRSIEIRSLYGHDAFLKEVDAVSDIVHDVLCEEVDP